MEEGYVHCRQENNISTIEFFHPLSNSMPGYLLRALANKIMQQNETESRLILLKSAGERAFCAGASFQELASIKTKEEGLKFFSGFAEVINTMRTCKKIIITRIQGKCVGGGVGIAAAADYSIATEAASVKLSELALGIGPFVIGPAVERKIGKAAFGELSIDASQWRSANWANEKGLFTEVHESMEEANVSVNRLATALSGYSPEAMAAMKKALWEGTEHWEQLLQERAAISGQLVLSEATRTAIEAFKNRKQ